MNIFRFEPYYNRSLDHPAIALSADTATAIAILNNNDPLPLDLAARLLDQGIDITELENKHG